MRLRTVARLGMVLSVVLFCTAVGFYGFTRLSIAGQSKDVDLFSLVPSKDCMGVMECDNIAYFLNEFPQLSYGSELDSFRLSGLFEEVIGGMDDYTAATAHGLSSRMSRVVVSFHASGSLRDQVIYFRTADTDEGILDEMLKSRSPQGFMPKKQKYRGKQILLYPLYGDDFLAVYSEPGFLVASYQVNLIEQVIDAREERSLSLASEPVFVQAVQRKKTRNFLTLYGRNPSMPFLQQGQGEGCCWSEFDLHINSDVIYLTGDTFTGDRVVDVQDCLAAVPDVCEDSVVLSARRDRIADYMDEAASHDVRTLFDECVVNLSHEAIFMLVADMDKVSSEVERFTPYVPRFLLANVLRLRSFIFSTQLSWVNNRLSHILILTYKD